ncbi:MAG: saccharopine dehydrogenase family protein [Psychroflexus halocasei]|uniref:saccharopine dehydrogenase family protein n=1 Tax=Psychroflexus sp. S27 TaxID=1982757 RepID=UPI000C2ACA64|nr:saccharopine dehydrogenase C-terminal domain-containing protein [Psychroflexus sp. S27]PJX22717.1 saccharopine dehydrogenase [Psychroflexus sp. S27]
MTKLLIIGAGKSTSALVRYLDVNAQENNLQILIADKDMQAAKKSAAYPSTKAIELDIFNTEERQKQIKAADMVVSMLPARFHIEVAKDCVNFGKNMATASYVSDEMAALDKEVKAKGLTFMNEIGVDPGVDHMSAMKVIDEIRENGGKLILFESFTGGLVAPESDDNLWNYKFTWNPRNVVVAGQGGPAKFIQEGKYKYIPYQRLFRRTEFLEVPGYGRFEGLANRNSLAYREVYGIEDIPTLYRGTLRRVGFSKAWNVFVQLGVTDDTYTLEDSEPMTYREFFNTFLPYSPTDSVELKLRHSLKIDQDDLLWEKLLDLDIFNNKKTIGIKNATPAQALQSILEEKWMLKPDDKDMIVMYHKFGYELDGQKKQIDSTMVSIGEDQTFTAMSRTVGLPLGIAIIKMIKKEVTRPGVLRPIYPEIYKPILKELEEHGIEFTETQTEYLGYNPNNLK